MLPNKPWLSSYPETTPAKLDLPFQTLDAYAKQALTLYADRPAFCCLNQELTFSQVDQASSRFASFLRAQSLSNGDRICLFLPNGLEFIIAAIGAWKLGLVIVATNPKYTTPELRHQVIDSGARMIVADVTTRDVWQQLLDEGTLASAVIVGDCEPGSSVTCWGEALKLPPCDSLTSARTAEDLALIQYTGGTTGVSKGAMLTHRNILSNIAQIDVFLEKVQETENPTILTALPIYHIFALTVNFLYFLSKGARNVLVSNPSETSELFGAINRFRPNMTTGVNTLLLGLLNAYDAGLVDLTCFHFVIGGGASVQPVIARRWHKVTGCWIVEGYGLSETSPVVTLNPPWREKYRAGIGIPVPFTDIQIRAENGAQLGVMEIGEICVRGPQVMTGYYKRAVETREVLDGNGWFRTGDVGYMEQDGQFVISDRKKDMILVSGFNVFPNEVEAAAAALEGIDECACVGVPDEQTGERVILFVVPSGDSVIDPAVIRTELKRSLAAYKVPKEIRVVEALPKSTVGKILRRQLRDKV